MRAKTIAARAAARVLARLLVVDALVLTVRRVLTLQRLRPTHPRHRLSSGYAVQWRPLASPKESKHAATLTEKVPQGAEGP